MQLRSSSVGVNRFSTNQQLALAFAALAILVLLVSGLALHDLQAANQRFASYVHGPVEREVMATGVRALANRRAIAVRDMVLVKAPAERAAAKTAAMQAHEGLQASLAALAQAVAAAPDASARDRELVAAIEATEARYTPVALAIVELAAAGRPEEATDKMISGCRPLLAALLADTDAFVDHSQAEAARQVEAGSR
jgi:hypothetical protein